MRLNIAALFLTATAVARAADTQASTPPPFFLQDPSDSLCLAGEDFKRCSLNTLFYVVGSPGSYQIHKRSPDGVIDEEDDGMCLSKKSCKDGDVSKVMEAKLAKCSHCGAKNWNILGDAETGYVLTEGDGKTCLVREQGSNRAMTAPCDSQDVPYTPLQLQFASASDIKTMSSPGARMISAASDGDKKAIQALLKEGVEINVRDWDDLTALIPAASSGNVDICKFLIKEGIDVNAKDKDGITALMEASIMGHTKVVELLIENGAEVDAFASSMVTALWLAASEGKTDVLKVLLKHGAESKNARVDGISALMTASVGGHTEAVKLLLENGADPTAADNDGLTPLMNAAENGNVEIMKLLVEKADDPKYIDTMSNTGFNALIISSAHGKTDAIEYLLSAGANIGAVAENGVSALMYASASNHVDAMKLLIEKGNAEIDFKHTNGGTALLEAATGGAVDAIKYLIEKGASFDLVDNDGVTPLMAIASQGSIEGQTAIIDSLKAKMSTDEFTKHMNLLSHSGGSAVMFAAAGGHLECAKQLMELGANVKQIARATPEYLEKLAKNIADGTVQEDEPHVDGLTALHVAAQGGHTQMVKELLEAGVEVSIADDEGRTPLLLAIKGNYGEIARLLIENGADPNTVYTDDKGVSHNLLFDSIMVENVEFAKALISKGADLYHQDEKQVSTLLQASHRGFDEIVKLLIERDAKKTLLETTSDEGITPLIAASSEGHIEVVKALLAGGANVNGKDQDNTNALMAAAARGHLDVVRELLEAGAAINEQNNDGHTALMFAYNGKSQVETLWERYTQFVSESKTEKGEQEADDSGTGTIIREALDKHLALVDLLLKKGADPNVKDKEGHTAKDFDFHPDADAEILSKQAKAEKIRDESKNEL